MTQIIHIHPHDPQERLLQQVVEVLQLGGVIIYPTDSAYALGCRIGEKNAMERIRCIRKLDKNHNFTLICRDLSEIGTYAIVDNSTYRLLKAATPGPYTFILHASDEVPRRLRHPKRKTIGIRVPDNAILQNLLGILNEPLMSVTLILPPENKPIANLDQILDKVDNQVDIIIEGGICSTTLTTVIDCTSGAPEIVREGLGDTSIF